MEAEQVDIKGCRELYVTIMRISINGNRFGCYFLILIARIANPFLWFYLTSLCEGNKGNMILKV